MSSQSDREAWARFGAGMSNIFQDWGRQRTRNAEFQAQMAMDELQRKDAKEASDRANEITQRRLELNEEIAAEDRKRWEADQEYKQELRDMADETLRLTGGRFRGYQEPGDVGAIAGQELGGRIRGEQGFLPQIRAAATGLAPALQKGFEEAPRTQYADMGEYIEQKGLSDKQIGLLYDAAPQLFTPDYANVLSAATAYVDYGLALPAEYAYLKPKLDEKAGEIKAEKDATKRYNMLELEVKTVQLDRMKNPQNYADLRPRPVGGGGPTIDLSKIFGDATTPPPPPEIEVDLERLSAGIKVALEQGIARDALEADLVENYGYSDEDAKKLLDELIASGS